MSGSVRARRSTAPWWAGLALLSVFACAPQRGAGAPAVAHVAPEQAAPRRGPTLTVGSFRGGWPPYENNIDGRVDGLSYDYLRAIADQLGVVARTRSYPTWPALLEAACRGEVDVVMNVSITAARTRCLSFTRPYQSVQPALVGRVGDEERLQTAPARLRIAVETDHVTQEIVRDAYPGARIIPVPDQDAALALVATQRADAYIGNPYVVARLLRDRPRPNLAVLGPAPLPPSTLHFATPNDRATLAAMIDRALAGLPTATRRRIDARWLDPQLAWASEPPALDEAQRAWLQQLPVLRVAFDPHWSPLTTRGADGQMSGIVGDYLQRIQDQLGLRLEPVPVRDWRQARALVAAGKADIAPATGDAGYGPDWRLTKPLVSFPCVIVTRRDSETVGGLDDLAGKRIALSDPDLGARMARRLPGAARVGVASEAEGLRMVANGGADAYVGNLASVDNALRDHRYDGLHVAAPAGFSDHVGLAVRAPYAALVPMFDRVVANMGNDARQQIRKRWLKVDYDYGFARPMVWWGIAAALAIIGLLVGAYLRLRAEISRRREADTRLREISRNLPAVVFKLRRSRQGKYRFTYVTGNPRPLFGLDAAQIMRDPRQLFRRIAAGERLPLREALEQSARTLEPVSRDFHALGATGQRWISLHGVPRRTEDDAVHWSGYWVDSTATHEQNEAIEQARAEAVAAAAAKSNFLAVMSHEIRTPMAGLSGLLELLGRTPLNAAQRQLLSTSAESAASLRQILDDVLDFSKAEAGEMRLEAIDVDLRQIACGVLEIFAPQARQKGLELRQSLSPALAALHVGDPFRLRQVLLNLVGNAVKFTASGHVEVEIQADDEGILPIGALQTIRLRISDTGVGIPPEQQAQLFRPFIQADATTTRRHGGTGLGLSICRQLVDLMGGTMQLESQAGAGTRLTVEIRLPVQRHTAPETRLRGRRARLHIANARLRGAVQSLLEGWDMHSELVDGALPDVWITDTLPAALPPERTVLLKPLTTDIPPFFHHVADDPLLPSALRHALQGIIDVADPLRPAKVPTLPGPQQERDIAPVLVVEDHPTNQMLVGLQLRELGYPYLMARDGEVALALLERITPSLVLTDISMPHMDGHTLARRIREREAGATRIPIIAMTANVLDDRHTDSRSGDLDAQIHKPVDLGQLASLLARWLPADVVGTSGGAKPASPAVTGNPKLAQLLDRLGAEAATLLRSFLDTTQADLGALETAIAADDATAASQRIHRISGALGYFGYVEAATAGRELSNLLETTALRSQRAACEDFVGTLQRICDDLAALLERMPAPRPQMPESLE